MFRKRALYLVALLWKMICNSGDPMSLRRPVALLRHDSFMSVTWLIHVCDMTHSCEWRDLLVCVTCLIYVCDMTHSCMWHDSFMCVTWLIHVCDMTHSCEWRDLLVCVTCLIRSGVMSYSAAETRVRSHTHGFMWRRIYCQDQCIGTRQAVLVPIHWSRQ